MQLPFTREQFFDLFVACNDAVWPAVVALWIASTVIVALRLPACLQHDRWVSALLAGHWASDRAVPIAGSALAIFSMRRTTPGRLRAVEPFQVDAHQGGASCASPTLHG